MSTPDPANAFLFRPVRLLLALCVALGMLQPAMAKGGIPHAMHWQINADIEQPYALVRPNGKNTINVASKKDRHEIDAVKQSIQGDFLWFKSNGKSYVIQDPDLLAKAQLAFAPMDRLGAQLECFGQDMDPYGQVTGQMPMPGAPVPPEKTVQAPGKTQDKLGKQIEKLAARLDHASETERAQLLAQIRQLALDMKPRAQELGQQPGLPPHKTEASLQDLSGNPLDSVQPIKDFGKKMARLGQEMEKQSRQADQAMHDLIQEAINKGLARPVPGIAG